MTNDPNDPLADDGNVDDFDDAQFDDFEGGRPNSLKEMWENNPLVKIGVIVAAFVFIVGGVILFGGSSDPMAPSVTGKASTLKQAPGTAEVTKSMADAMTEQNINDAEIAQRTGTSALPVPITPPSEPFALQDPNLDQEDPLARWRRIQEERQKAQVTEAPNVAPPDPNAAAVDALAQAMVKQMNSVLANQVMTKTQIVKVTDYDSWLEKRMPKIAEGEGGPLTDREQEILLDIIIPAGSIVYSQLLLEANSDAPGPILAQIVAGPLAGARLLGRFQVLERYLVLNFDTVVIDGISYDTQAVAVDPKTANTGMITEIDRRYFQRIILPAAAAFVEGMGSAIADAGSTSVSVSGDTVVQEENDLDTEQEVFNGIEEAASKASEILDDEASRIRPMLRVAAGTPMGVLFIEPVTKEAINQ